MYNSFVFRNVVNTSRPSSPSLSLSLEMQETFEFNIWDNLPRFLAHVTRRHYFRTFKFCIRFNSPLILGFLRLIPRENNSWPLLELTFPRLVDDGISTAIQTWRLWTPPSGRFATPLFNVPSELSR